MHKLKHFGKPFMVLIRAHINGDDEEQSAAQKSARMKTP